MAVSIFPTPRTVAAASASAAGGNVFGTTITATGARVLVFAQGGSDFARSAPALALALHSVVEGHGLRRCAYQRISRRR